MAPKLDMQDKAALSVAGGFILVWLVIISLIGYVAVHFILKFW